MEVKRQEVAVSRKCHNRHKICNSNPPITGISQGYDHMLSIYQSNALNKFLTARLSCGSEIATVDYYLCQHCTNFDALETDVLHQDQISKAFLHLTQEQRTVIYLKIIAGLSNRDVAHAISRSIGTVKAIQNRAFFVLSHLLFINNM